MPVATKGLALSLLGPTATGKTNLAVRLREQLPVEIISVDSALVYRGMDIGTAKPDAEVLCRAPHRLIDICEPWESYSAGRFVRDATAEMREIIAAGRIPLLVGGTMLYFRALQNGLADLPEADVDLRAELDARAQQLGWPVLHAQLAELDPAAAARIATTDAQRIQRALEVCLLTGRTMSALQDETRLDDSFHYINLGLWPGDRARLHRDIAERFDRMLEEGLLEEVKKLLALPQMSAAAASMRSVGYRQICEYLAGDDALDKACEKAVTATRRLAKRQMTWMRSRDDVQSFDSQSKQLHEEVLGFLRNRAFTSASL